MANAKTDNNSIKTMLGTLDSDGSTPTNIEATPTSHKLRIDDNTTGTDQSADSNADIDANKTPVLLAVSESDGETPVQLYVNSSGRLLVDST